MRYVFGNYTLDTLCYELRRAGTPVPLRPKVFHLLAYLLAHRDRIVPRQELCEHLWPHQFVSDATLDACLAQARQAVGDRGRTQRVIQTRHGYGYRFVASVEVHDDPADEADARSLPPIRDESAGGEPTWLRAGIAVGPAPVPEVAGEPPVPLTPVRPPPPRALAGERKVVTVLVCTLANVAMWAQRLEAEALYWRMQAFFALVLEEVERYEGTLQRVLDDGVLVLFGAPVTHENHAQRAVLAALALQERVRASPPDPAYPHEELVVHIGLHTGQVVIGHLGDDGRLTFTPVGDTTHLAAWLAQQAAAGSALVSEATARLVQGAVCLEACPPTSSLGPTTPTAYKVLGLGPHRSPLPTHPGRPLSPLVGRQLELATLRALLTRVEGHQGQVAGIVGEPGMGKTRLVHEFWQSLGSTRVTYLEGRCVSYGQAIPYLPVRELLQQACGLSKGESPQAITAHVQQHLQAIGMVSAEEAPYLLHLLGGPDATAWLAGVSPQAIRIRTFAALHQLLLRQSQRQPLLVVVENLHWIDPTSQEFLVELVERLAGLPLLLLVTCRPGYRPPWMDKSYASQLTLSRLGPEDSQRVVQAVLPAAHVPEHLLQDILAKAAGNPLFLEELAWAVREHGGRQLPSEIPATVQAILAARIDRLPPEVKHLLQTAAVIGPEVPWALLQAIADSSEDELRRALRQLQAAEFLYETRPAPKGAYTFKHALTHEVAYSSLLQEHRRALHARIAAAIEHLDPDHRADQVERLARHYTEAGLMAQAIPYWQRAGQCAIQRSAHVEAIAHLTTGLALLAALPETPARAQQELDLLIALGPVLMDIKGAAAPEVEQTYARVDALRQQVGETPQLFLTLHGLQRFYINRGVLSTARELGEQLVRLARREAMPTHLLAAHATLRNPLFFLGDYATAWTHFEQGMSLTDLTLEKNIILYSGLDPGIMCLVMAANALWCLGYPTQALRRCQEALAQALSYPTNLAFTRLWAAVVHHHRHEVPAVQAQAEALLTLATAQGLPIYVGLGTCWQGWVMAVQGQGEAGLAQFRQGLAAVLATGQMLARPRWLTLLAEAAGYAGQVEVGLCLLAEALAAFEENEQGDMLAETYRLQGELLLLRPTGLDAPQAEACFEQSLAIARRQQAKSWELRAAMSLSRLWQRQGKRDAARQLLAEVYGWFTEGFDTADLQAAKALLEELV